MRVSRSARLLVVGVGIVALAASADAMPMQKNFIAVLNGGQENPAITTDAMGVAYFTLNGKTLCYSITYSGLGSAETAAHIHGPGAAGTNAGVLMGFAETTSPKNACVTIDNATKKAIKKGTAYVNVHTAGNPGGEIRGQIVPVD